MTPTPTPMLTTQERGTKTRQRTQDRPKREPRCCGTASPCGAGIHRRHPDRAPAGRAAMTLWLLWLVLLLGPAMAGDLPNLAPGFPRVAESVPHLRCNALKRLTRRRTPYPRKSPDENAQADSRPA